MNLEITEEMLQEVTKEPEKIVEHIVPVKEEPKKEEKPKVKYDWFDKEVKNVEVEEEFPKTKPTREEKRKLRREVFDDYRNGRIKWIDAAKKMKMKQNSFYVAYMNYKNSWFTKV